MCIHINVKYIDHCDYIVACMSVVHSWFFFFVKRFGEREARCLCQHYPRPDICVSVQGKTTVVVSVLLPLMAHASKKIASIAEKILNLR